MDQKFTKKDCATDDMSGEETETIQINISDEQSNAVLKEAMMHHFVTKLSIVGSDAHVILPLSAAVKDEAKYTVFFFFT